MSTEAKSRVIVREWRDCGETGIEAFLPDVGASYGGIMSYEHIGQHSEVSIDYYRHTHPVDYTRLDVVALLDELKGIGYNVRLTKRLVRPFAGWAK